MTHLEVLDDNNLSDDEKEEPANDNDEVSSPQIVHVQRECGLDIIRPTDNARSRLSTVKGAGLVGPHRAKALLIVRTRWVSVARFVNFRCLAPWFMRMCALSRVIALTVNVGGARLYCELIPHRPCRESSEWNRQAARDIGGRLLQWGLHGKLVKPGL